MSMLAHLLDLKESAHATPLPVEAAAPALLEDFDLPTLVDAQVKTADLIALFDDDDADAEVLDDAAKSAARETFLAMTNGIAPETIRTRLTQLKTPRAVRHLVGMLTAFEWDFVEQAKQMRGYVTAQLLEETRHPDAKIRLKALEMLGKITEISLFTERTEVTVTHQSEADVEAALKERLTKYLTKAASPAPGTPTALPISDAVVLEIPATTPTPDAIELEIEKAQEAPGV